MFVDIGYDKYFRTNRGYAAIMNLQTAKAH